MKTTASLAPLLDMNFPYVNAVNTDIRRTILRGAHAKENFDRAAQLVKEGRYAEAMEVELLPSDYVVIGKRIANAKKSAQ